MEGDRAVLPEEDEEESDEESVVEVSFRSPGSFGSLSFRRRRLLAQISRYDLFRRRGAAAIEDGL